MFDAVRQAAQGLPDVTETVKYDGSPVLKLRGSFLAGMAMHASAERDTMVIRCEPQEREQLIADAPGTYYVTPYYRRHPVVLVRLGQLDQAVLRELLLMSKARTKAAAARVSRGRR